ncbi:hypothetical protein Dsi01nite_097220 [Dactylosporangium siamense]|uniref:Uncharacterized protein n=2 Tax=Dactylosporangium siamense TaxID=685454 RepID=A0A919PYN8_9ACTN|nr:hypothetical protein Dsi01nite_097220 [Dactylosporangium siamense]
MRTHDERDTTRYLDGMTALFAYVVSYLNPSVLEFSGEVAKKKPKVGGSTSLIGGCCCAVVVIVAVVIAVIVIRRRRPSA